MSATATPNPPGWFDEFGTMVYCMGAFQLNTTRLLEHPSLTNRIQSSAVLKIQRVILLSTYPGTYLLTLLYSVH